MKVLGWILTILGGLVTMGGLIQLTTPDEHFYAPSWFLGIGVLVLGIVILNYKKRE